MFFKNLSVLLLWTKIASALDELINPCNAEATFVQRTRVILFKPLKPFHVGIHWIVLSEYSQVSTHMPGFQ